MDAFSLVVFGVFVLLNWLHLAYFERIQNWRTPWDRWARVPPDMNWIVKMLAIGFAIFVSLMFVIMLLAAAAG